MLFHFDLQLGIAGGFDVVGVASGAEIEAAILAADEILAGPVLVITTASCRAVWKRAVPEWSPYKRNVRVVTPKDTITKAQL